MSTKCIELTRIKSAYYSDYIINKFMLHRVTSDELHFKVIIRSTNQFKISVQN